MPCDPPICLLALLLREERETLYKKPDEGGDAARTGRRALFERNLSRNEAGWKSSSRAVAL